jgi:hypothetical protein
MKQKERTKKREQKKMKKRQMQAVQREYATKNPNMKWQNKIRCSLCLMSKKNDMTTHI